MMDDLRDIAVAIEAHPDIAGVKRRVPDECIDRLTWTVWIYPGWRHCDMGYGNTIEEAFHNAVANQATSKAAA